MIGQSEFGVRSAFGSVNSFGLVTCFVKSIFNLKCRSSIQSGLLGYILKKIWIGNIGLWSYSDQSPMGMSSYFRHIQCGDDEEQNHENNAR